MENITKITASVRTGSGSGGGITPYGTVELTDTNKKNVTQYAYAQISDENLTADNIAAGVSILGITGTYHEAVGDAEDYLF